MYKNLTHESQTKDLYYKGGSVHRELKDMIIMPPLLDINWYFHFIVRVLPQLNTSTPLTSNWCVIGARDHPQQDLSLTHLSHFILLLITHIQFFLPFPAFYKLSIYNVIFLNNYTSSVYLGIYGNTGKTHLLDITWRNEPGYSLEVSMSMNQPCSTDKHTKWRTICI